MSKLKFIYNVEINTGEIYKKHSSHEKKRDAIKAAKELEEISGRPIRVRREIVFGKPNAKW